MSNRGDDEVVWCSVRSGWPGTVGDPLGTGAVARECRREVKGRDARRRSTAIGSMCWALGGDLACLQADDGKIVWRHSLIEDFGGQLPMWRFNESPLVDGDKVICTPGGEDAMLVALSKLTGETIWKSQVTGGAEGGPGWSQRRSRRAGGPGTSGRSR